MSGVSRSQRGTDHPRSRGVYDDQVTPARAEMGSSPLARGLQFLWQVFCGLQRIIPARAGFTSLLKEYQDGGGGSSPLARGLLHACLE